MRGTIHVKEFAEALDKASASLDLGEFANADGSGRGVLEITIRKEASRGTFGSFLVKGGESAGRTDIALVDSKGLTDLAPATRYAFPQYITAVYSYTPGADQHDVGGRVAVDCRVYGLPEWQNVRVCREADIASLAPVMFGANGGVDPTPFMELAKRDIERSLRSRNINPDLLFTDGHPDNPTIEGLRTAGAYLVALFAMNEPGVRWRKDDSWKMDVERLAEHYAAEFDRALEAGLPSITLDADTDGVPDADEPAQHPVRLMR